MSSILKKKYLKRLFNQGFYINENDKNNKNTPPMSSMVMDIGNEVFVKIKKLSNLIPPDVIDKHVPMKTLNKKDRDIFNNKKQDEPEIFKRKRSKIKCPTIPFEWNSNINKGIPTMLMY